MPYAAIDLFCGVGGLTKGLEQAGINVVAGLDFEPSCQYAYEKNNNAKFIRKRTIASTCSYASFSAIIVSHDTESKKLST